MRVQSEPRRDVGGAGGREARGDGGAGAGAALPTGSPRELARLFPHTVSAILRYLLQPRLGMGLFTRARRAKLLSGRDGVRRLVCVLSRR